MIEQITIAGHASFGTTPEIMNDLSVFNFVFGANGTGKTTVSRVLANCDHYAHCNVAWSGNVALQILVYNRDFVAKHFHQSVDLQGIFTLGEKNADALKQIADAKKGLDKLTKKLAGYNDVLNGADGSGGKAAELKKLEEECRSFCWKQKQNHDAKLKGAFEGYRNSADRFKEKLFQERKVNVAALHPLADLEAKAATVFADAPTRATPIIQLSADAIISLERDPILKKKVIGKADIDIAAMIQTLGNSDWVRTGRQFYDANDKVCPFCQQETTDALAVSLNNYFDEAFEKDSKAIEGLATNYATDSARLVQRLDSLLAAKPAFLDVAKLKAEKDILDARVLLNSQRIATKKKEPSQSIELESLVNVIAAAKALIEQANIHIAAHNKMVDNLGNEQTELTARVWRYLIDGQLKSELESYDSRKNGLIKSIAAIETQIRETKSQITGKKSEIAALEKETTSIQPTIDEINALLKSFGFIGFSLAKADNQPCYKLVRPDGSEAKESLSEGERTFVTFLYFYHLLKGSDSESGTTSDRVVVFDDPVSSLDSEILFIVGSLIKGLFDEVRAGAGHIKQIFVLTHNVYFHKEVTFNARRVNVAMREETFWMIKKAGLESKLERHPSNPIRTSYEMLWTEVRNPNRSNLTIQNTLRRIVENYFRILGGVDPDKICAKFDGKERLICKSLFSWVNDGSHYAHDDLYVSIDDGMVDTYLSVFRAIFHKCDHLQHYKMMMGDAFPDEDIVSVAS